PCARLRVVRLDRIRRKIGGVETSNDVQDPAHHRPPRPIARCGHDRLRSPRIGPWIIGLDAPKRDVWARRGNLSSDGIQHAIDDAHDKGVPCRRQGAFAAHVSAWANAWGVEQARASTAMRIMPALPRVELSVLEMVGVLPS